MRRKMRVVILSHDQHNSSIKGVGSAQVGPVARVNANVHIVSGNPVYGRFRVVILEKLVSYSHTM